ncbi:HNH endonuclease [Candidatus Thiosymbion oneisti]|uniref:HNH endonuclease n=1 Tax=Candidatus Thiosymbion oneisti TaxID=589554 RepID=UPI000B7E028D|nr:HNH endonuclease [Candidatus Thiosymbion oneisti]
MDTDTFIQYFSNVPIRFLWHYDVIEQYVPVVEQAIEDTKQFFDIDGTTLSVEDIGIVLISIAKSNEKKIAFYIKNRKIRSLGSIYSEFKHNFHTITSGDDDHLGIPLPPKTLECCKQLFATIGRPEECAIQFWEHTQSLRRPITRFQTLANKSINKQRSVSPKLRLQVLRRDGFKCAFCGRDAEDTALHVDHIHPVSKGGRNDIDHLVTLCRECNLGKGTQSAIELLR